MQTSRVGHYELSTTQFAGTSIPLIPN